MIHSDAETSVFMIYVEKKNNSFIKCENIKIYTKLKIVLYWNSFFRLNWSINIIISDL